jgi:hypothetical protein
MSRALPAAAAPLPPDAADPAILDRIEHWRQGAP